MSDTPEGPDRPARPATGVRDGDAGLFGPESVTWRLHAEPLMGVAGLRALLLQALHPVAMAAFVQETSAHEDLWGRLSRTAEYLAVTTYGSTTQAMLAASRVRAIHARVRGTLPGGVEYAADDPQLLAWVHCCLVASFLEVLTRGGVSLTGAEQDGYVAEQVKAAMLVGLEPDEVPHDRAGLHDYFRVIRPALVCTPAARRAAVELVTPPLPAHVAPGTPARPAWAGRPDWPSPRCRPGGVGSTRCRSCRAAGLTDAATTVGLRSLRAALRGVQAGVPPLREGPHLRVAKARLDPP